MNEPLLGGSSSSPAGGNNSSTLWTQFSDSISDYVPLRSGQRSNDEEAYLALSHWERFLAFLLCQAGAAFCFLIAFLTLPMLAIKPRKFAVAFSMGSLLFMLGYVLTPTMFSFERDTLAMSDSLFFLLRVSYCDS